MAFVEMREYTLQPEGHKPYVALSEKTGDLRCQILPFLGAFTVESGTDINRIFHFYAYTSFDERDALRTAGATNKAWLDYVSEGRKHTRKQQSSVLQVPCAQPSPAVAAALRKCQQRAAGDISPTAPVVQSLPAYLLCTYQAPDEAVAQLLSSQAAVDGYSMPDNAGTLMIVGSVALGAAPGTIVELWRFPSAAAALQAQSDAAAAAGSNNQRGGGVITAWRRAVMPGVVVKQQNVAQLRPTKWSNMQ